MSERLNFTTAIITYPSDYNKLLTLELIKQKFNSLISYTTKLVIAKEEADSEIQRDHYHIYWDDKKQKSIRGTSYFDIPLPEPVVVFIHPDKSRNYQSLNEMEQQLCWDNGEEMVAKLKKYCEDNDYLDYDVLKVAHPNIQLKREYGDKYFMLKYVLKQKLLTQYNKNIQKDIEYLMDNMDELEERRMELILEEFLFDGNCDCLEELLILMKKYKEKMNRNLRKRKRSSNGSSSSGYSTGSSSSSSGSDEKHSSPEWELCQEIRHVMFKNQGITKNEVINMIRENEEWWYVYATSYLNYNKLINDLFKNKPNAKPQSNYDLKFWLPRSLYDYIIWLDHWVENWMTGKRELCEHRPKGLCLIGDSRTGKTSLMTLLGPFSYFKNIWNSDNWEFLPPYTIMDDMDAQDEGKGLSFSWYKPWFGSQDAITITDKYRPKEDIINGKPLIWLNNFKLEDTFKSESALRYIEKNMIIIDIGSRPLFEKPDRRCLGGFINYVEYDPKTCWYYKNVVSKNNVDGDSESVPNENEKNYIWIDETQKVLEKMEDIEPLSIRKEKLKILSENKVNDDNNDNKEDDVINDLIQNMKVTGRPINKRIRTEN